MSDELKVRLVELAPMRVVSVLAYGPSPELDAWNRLLEWARAQGLWDWSRHRFFGFNNPNPSAGSPNYGYEQWMTVESAVQASDPLQIKQLRGGRFAVARCRLSNITATWMALYNWVQDGAYEMADNECLEECLTAPATEHPDAEFDLYLPIQPS
jgi:DNA gyrase inhibitor GyrI